jgi:hypothetical protein
MYKCVRTIAEVVWIQEVRVKFESACFCSPLVRGEKRAKNSAVLVKDDNVSPAIVI